MPGVPGNLRDIGYVGSQIRVTRSRLFSDLTSPGPVIGSGDCIEITKDISVSDILKEYGDIADVMEVFGVLLLIGALFLLPSIKLHQRGRVQGY